MDNTKHPSWNPPKVDKRTKSYKEYKDDFEKRINAKGFGDIIAEASAAIGLDKAVKWVAGEDCGCKERAHLINNLPKTEGERPKWRLINCPTQKQKEYLDDLFSKPRTEIELNNQQGKINEILTHVFERKFDRLGCCWGYRIHEAKKIHQAYSK